MPKFYFTYGSACGHPFNGGWTEVDAPNYVDAVKLFRTVHQDDTEGFINCAGIYTEEEFKKTKMFCGGNFGRNCVERLSVSQVILARDAINTKSN